MESQFWSRPTPAEDYLCEDESKLTKYPFPIFADTPKPSVDDTDPWESYFSIIYRNIFCPTFFRFCFGQTRLDTTSTQFGTMADGDSEVVFGNGRPTLEHEPTSKVKLFARSNTDDTREPSRTLDEAPLQSSTPMVVRLSGGWRHSASSRKSDNRDPDLSSFQTPQDGSPAWDL